MGNFIYNYRIYRLVKKRDIEGLRRINPTVIHSYILDEALKKQDGIFECCLLHEYDMSNIKVNIPVESYPLVLKALNNRFDFYKFIVHVVNNNNIDLLDYLLSNGAYKLTHWNWQIILVDVDTVEVLLVIFKHVLIEHVGTDSLFKFWTDERVAQLIRRFASKHLAYLDPVKRSKTILLLLVQQQRRKLLSQICMRKNIPCDIHFIMKRFLG
jgi:hypothetical protein